MRGKIPALTAWPDNPAVKQLDPQGPDGCLCFEQLREITGGLIVWPEKPMPKTPDEADATTFPDDYEG